MNRAQFAFISGILVGMLISAWIAITIGAFAQ